MKKKEIQFNNACFQGIVERFLQQVGSKSVKNKLDNISSDIKSMESFLSKNLFEESTSFDEVHSLHWDINTKRIMYKEVDEEQNVIICKPLIECKAFIRLNLQDQLEEFFKQCIETIQSRI